MPKDRFFINEPLNLHTTVHLTEDEHHHLKVMRAQTGETIEIVNGQGALAHAHIDTIGKHTTTLTLIHLETPPVPPQPLILAQALLRPKNLDLVIEKGTELGATAFWLFPGDRSEKTTLSPSQLERLRHITIAALKQSGRLFLPSLSLLPPLAHWERSPANPLWGDLDSSTPLTPQKGPTTLLIGPEKGFSQEEENCLRHNFKGRGIRLSHNTLRAETAALCALSVASCY